MAEKKTMQHTIKTSAGDIKISGLKRRQIKELKASGVDIYKGSEDPEAFLDAILSISIDPEDQDKLDDLVAYEAQELLKKIMDLTFMTADQRKNFVWQWDSTLPGVSIPAPTVEKTDSSSSGDVPS
jgi:hypothetical protein